MKDKKFKNKKIIIPALLLVITAASVTPFLFAQAASTDGTNVVAKVKTWVGVKGNRGLGLMNKNKNKTPKTAAQTAAMAAAQAAQTVKIAAVNTALANNDYNAWVTAMNALNVNPNASATATVKTNPKITSLMSKINATNFPTLVDAYNQGLKLQADLTSLGFSSNYGKGMMPGLGMGMGFGLNK